MDLARPVGSSGMIQYRGLFLESKDGITAKAELDIFNIVIDGISKNAGKRLLATCAPSGEAHR
jgi:hypothetical protein